MSERQINPEITQIYSQALYSKRNKHILFKIEHSFHRCVSQEDKSLSIGINEALVCFFAFIPGPIIYGALLGECLIYVKLNLIKS